MSNQNFKTGVIADVGYAEYKGKETFYLVLQDDKGNLADPIRGKGLEEAFNKAGDLKKGDTVNLKDFGIDEATKKRVWEIERHEPYQDLNNEIGQDKELVRQKSVDDIAKEAENAWKDKKERKPQDFEYIPDNIKNNYVGIVKNKFLGDEKINYYDKDDKSQMNIAFEDRKDSLNTSRQDEKTINAMLDLASSKGWTAIKLKGTEEFKQKAWLEASLRGIETKGYEPTERDLATLQSRQKERSSNTVIAEKIEEPAQNRQLLNDKENHQIENNHQKIVDEALLIRENHYNNGYNYEQEVLSKDYHKLNDDDIYIKKSLDLDIQERQKQHYAIDKTSYSYFIKSTFENINISDNAKQDIVDKFNNRMTSEFNSNDSYDMPHENKNLRSIAIVARHDLAVTLDKFKVADKDLILKEYDERIINYSEQVYNHHKSFITEKTKDNDLSQSAQTQDKPQKTDKEIKQEIKTLLQNGIKDGSIKDRSDVVEKLKEIGYEVLRENEKSITLSNPHSDKDILLKGELFTKSYNALKSLNESLQPDSIKEKYPNISDENIAKVNLWRENVLSRFDTVEARQNALSRLKDTLPDVASGKKDLGYPQIPANEIKPEIEVRTPDSGDQSRSR